MFDSRGLNLNDDDQKPRILIVDDERFNINTLHAALKTDYRIMVAMSGEQALSAIERKLPDLILLDINMPGMDGYEVCRRVKQNEDTQHIPVVFISALSDSDNESYGLDLGASDYISKPFNVKVVRARVRTQIRLKQQSDLLAAYAFKDSLTGLYNRRAFDERLLTEWKRCRRYQRSLAILMLDVDYFKAYNDTLGHGVGDDCLRSVGRSLAKHLPRATDFAARYGGEEFVVVIPESIESEVKVIAERLRAEIEALAIPHPASGVSDVVTVSVGYALTVVDGSSSVTDLQRSADGFLYDAKGAGRNCVVGADLKGRS